MQTNEALALAYQQGDKKAGDKLIRQNEGLIWKEVTKHRQDKVSMSEVVDEQDLFQQGAIGMLQAANKFDKAKGCKFSTYAVYWIKQSITRWRMDNENTIRIPINAQEDYRHGRLKPKSVDLTSVVFSLDQNINGYLSRGDITLYHLLKLDTDPTELAERREYRSIVDSLLGIVHPKHRKFIELRFGLSGEEPKTLEEVAKIMGCSRQWVEQVVRKSCAKIKSYADAEGLANPL